MGSIRTALAAMPGDDLLFHRLSDSTIGAVWFHGRVRDGIGWVTDAMATKLWGRRFDQGKGEIDVDHLCFCIVCHLLSRTAALSLMVELSSANRAISIG